MFAWTKLGLKVRGQKIKNAQKINLQICSITYKLLKYHAHTPTLQTTNFIKSQTTNQLISKLSQL